MGGLPTIVGGGGENANTLVRDLGFRVSGIGYRV